MWQFWLIVSGIFFIFEIITIGFLVFWFAIGALFAMITSFFTENLIIQTSVFIISSSIMLFFTKPLLEKYITKSDKTRTNAYSIIGKTATVIVDINSNNNLGQIKINGEIWSAKSENSEIIKKDSQVIITKIEGVKVIVEPIVKNKIVTK